MPQLIPSADIPVLAHKLRPLRALQQNVVAKALQAIAGGIKEFVFATAIGGGKTIEAMHMIKWALENGYYVVIFCHGTTDLLNQWIAYLKKNGISSPNLLVTLPHSCRSAIKWTQEPGRPKQGLLIVDEAHEFYLAKGPKLVTKDLDLDPEVKQRKLDTSMVKHFIRETQPSLQILLTGTPSKFIWANKYDNAQRLIIFTPGVAVHYAGLADKEHGPYYSLPFVAMVAAPYMDMVRDAVGFVGTNFAPSAADSQLAVDNLIWAMLDTLEATDGMTNGTQRNTAVRHARNLREAREAMADTSQAVEVFKLTGQLLFVCASKAQAEAAHRGFLTRGVKALLSEMGSDPDSLNIAEFRNNPEIQVLVVVRRGNLGLNKDNLRWVVNATGSSNIDFIHQLLGRVVRPWSGGQKYFFQLTSGHNPKADALLLQAAICLFETEFFQKFDGQNGPAMNVTVHKSWLKPGTPSLTPHRVVGSKHVSPILPYQFVDLGLLAQAAVNGGSSWWDEFATLRLGEAMQIIAGIAPSKPRRTDAEMFLRVQDYYRAVGAEPTASSTDKLVAQMGRWLAKVTRGGATTYLQEVSDWMYQARWDNGFTRFKNFVIINSRLPRLDATDREEWGPARWYWDNQDYPVVIAWIATHLT